MYIAIDLIKCECKLKDLLFTPIHEAYFREKYSWESALTILCKALDCSALCMGSHMIYFINLPTRKMLSQPQPGNATRTLLC